ncbi:hypothetical protein V1507DRAFT_368022, partial [Lipomyces tetrasporus]
QAIMQMMTTFQGMVSQQNEAMNTQRREYQEQLAHQQEEIRRLQQMVTEARALAGSTKNSEATRMTKAKAREPDPFSSGPDLVETFLSQFRTYVELTGTPDEYGTRLLLLKSYLRGSALRWIIPLVDNPRFSGFEDFESFLGAFKKTFGDPGSHRYCAEED